jgi:nitric oxide dioxygenase
MLTAEHRAIVKATVPLLETGGEALTKHFYEILLHEHPEVRPLFNQAHQRSGAQQRALANGVLMYARHIDQLDVLGDLVETVVQKHVSLHVQPEHYPLVGRCLLRAIREVLGEAIATPAVLEAWGAAYGQLADILIGAEGAVYRKTADQRGGWTGTRRFSVAEKVFESDEICSFHLAPVDGGPVVAHTPGQYIALRVVIDKKEVRRNYSLSAAPNGQRYRISVKREAGGLVSNYLHDFVHPGDSLELFPPAGAFTLRKSDRPLVLLSGGVGITPTVAMLQAALDDDRPIHFIHAARNAKVHAFRDWVDSLAARHPRLRRFYCYADHPESDARAPHAVGRIGREQLEAWLPETRDVDVYYLGPVSFMQSMRTHLRALGVPESQSHLEFFGPASSLD